MHLIGRSSSVILPFAFFPFGVYLAYIYYADRAPGELLDAAPRRRLRRVADVPPGSRCPWRSRSVALVVLLSFVATGTTSSCRTVVLRTRTSTDHGRPSSNLLASTRRSTRPWAAAAVGEHLQTGELALGTLLAVVPCDRLPRLQRARAGISSGREE
jgi:multiple sugar transport system permease protein